MKLLPDTGKERFKCAVTNRAHDERGFIDTRNVLAGWDPPIHISATAVEEMGRMLGMVTKKEIESYVEHIQRMGAEIHDLTEQLEELKQHKELTERIGERVAA